jgi:hypothetical protein
MMLPIEVHSWQPIKFLLVEFWDVTIQLNALKLTVVLQQWLAHLPSFWLVSQATSLSRHLTKQWFDTLCKSTTMWKTLWVYLTGKLITTQQHQKLHLVTSRKFFLLDLFPSLREETKPPPPQRFSQIQMWIVLKATIDTTTTQDYCCLLHLDP